MGTALVRARLQRLRVAVRRAEQTRRVLSPHGKRWQDANWEIVHLRRTLRVLEASLVDPLLRNWCCCCDPPVLSTLAGWREGCQPGMRLPVHECPVCGGDDAEGSAWTRTEIPASDPS
jgi:hypothetical protein